mgnify:CR=1 FL=1
MITIGANRDKVAYGIKHYNIDTAAELTLIDTFNLTPGTTAFIIENSSTDLTVPDIFHWEKYIKETCKKAYFVN